MVRRCSAIAILLLAVNGALGLAEAQDLKSGPQPGQALPGSFQPLNINGAFADRYHCLVTEFRLNPVVLVFVRAQQEGIDPEVMKLLETLDKTAESKHGETGLESFVVFLSPDARSAVTEENVADGGVLIGEAVNRDKLVKQLRELNKAKAFKRLVVACAPPESVGKQYDLSKQAALTVVEYLRHQVFASFAFGEGQLKQDGVDRVLKGVEDMLQRSRKGPGIGK